MITLAVPIPLKNCRQCSHYRGGFCYGFGTAKQVFSESEAILCGTYTPLGQVQIGPIDSLGGQLVEYQIPSGLISTLKLADLAVTVDKLGLSSVIDSKVAVGAGIVESKLNLDFSTSDLDADIQTRLLAATYLAHDHSLADPTQVDHANLLNVLANQHHPQSHTLASHSTKAHAELTDVTTSQHHVKTVSNEISLASLLEKNHASLVSVTSDQHHPQNHTLASHSTKAHSELTDVNPNDHHIKYTNAEALAAVDEHLVLESANATWIDCPYEGAAVVASDKMDEFGAIVLQGTTYLIFSVPLPATRGGKKLYIVGTRISLSAADGSNYVTNTYIRGMGASTSTALDTDPTDKNTVGLHTDTSMTVDVSPYWLAKVTLSCIVPTPNNLKVQFVIVRYYYAA